MASRSTQQARTYDHLFDPLYATSGAKDFYRNVDAAKYSSVVRSTPVSSGMWSVEAELQRWVGVRGRGGGRIHEDRTRSPTNVWGCPVLVHG
jgi:hypothetical protein